MKQKVRDFLNAGLSRRKIATELGCTEYRVRAIMRSLVIDKLRKDETNTFEGRLRLSKVFSKKERTKITAVMNDIHIPYHDRRALAITLEYLRDIEPDTIILNGDIVDFYSVSRFQKDPMRIDTLQSELDETRALLTTIRRDHPRATMIYTKGNHEDRLERFLIDRASELMSLRCLSLDDLLGLSENKVKFVDTSVQVGKLEVTHGTLARNLPGSSVRGHFERTHASVLIGHVHRLNVQQFRNLYGTHTLVENGCLCGLQPEYASRMTNWQQGFSVIEYSPKTGDFEVHMRSIVDGIMSVGDRVYRAD